MSGVHSARAGGLAELVAASVEAPLAARSLFVGEVTPTSPMHKAPLLLQAKGKAWRLVGTDADLSAATSGADGTP